MQVPFRQGIITYPVVGGNQNFLLPTGNYVTLNTSNGRTDITFAHKDANYLISESVTINNAWGPIPVSTDAWLFWNIDLISGQRTFGFTLVAPLFGPLAPTSPVEDQHWFDTTETVMKVYINGHWREVVRVFAAKVNNGVFSPLGSILSLPYAGTQAGLTGNNFTGRIVFDNIGKPIRRDNNTLFTTTDQFFVQGSPVNTMKLEANVLQARATENMASFHVVKWSAFDTINLANYNDLNETVIGMLMEDVLNGNIATVITQGVVTNPSWNWTTVGAPLWVEENGELTDVDPNTVSLILYPKRKPPIARVLSPTQIFFDQGLGGMGEKGDPGDLPPLPVATTTVQGIAKLSVAATNPADPIVVGTNDPRLIGAPFAPLVHTHTATQVSVTPYTNFSGPNSQLALQQLDDAKVDIAGDTMTGFLTLNANPVNPLHAATKQYVDAVIPSVDTLTNTTFLNGSNQIAVNLSTLNGHYLRIDGTNAMTANLNAGTNKIVNVVDPTNPQDVATKAYVDANAPRLNTILSANNTNTIANANFAQTWNWQLTGNTTAFTFGESAPSTGLNNVLLKIQGQTGTTADLLRIIAGTSDVVNVAGSGAITLTSPNSQNVIISTATGSSPGNINITAGNGTTAGGTVIIIAGNGGVTNGDIRLITNNTDRLNIKGNGSWEVAGSPGLAGQVLISNGSTTTPSWQDLTLPYDIGLYASGTMQPNGTNLSGMLLTRDVFIDSLATHTAYAMVAPTNTANYQIIRVVTAFASETVIGNVSFAPGSNIGTVSIPDTNLIQGDIVLLRVDTPTVDPTIKDVFVTLTGCAIASLCNYSTGV